MNVEEIPEGEPVMASKFFVNNHPAIVLFDSSASHTFISKDYVDKYQLATRELRASYNIQSTGATQNTNLLASDVSLNLEGHMLKVLPLVMQDQRIDIILGMNWVK